MCKEMSDVQSYVRGYRERVYVNAWILKEKAGKSGKCPQHPGMCQIMNSLAGYVGYGGRDNWDF